MVASESDMDKTHYPCLHYCGPKELELPEDGEFEMTIRCRVKRETSSIEEDGSHWYECDIDVKKIVSVNGGEPETEEDEVSPPSISHSDAAEALDRIAAELTKLQSHEAEGMAEERD